MSATRLSLETDLRYAWNDVDSARPAVPSSQYWSWLNRACRAIWLRAGGKQKTNSITGDGVVSSFQLRGTDSASILAADVLGVKGFYTTSDGNIAGDIGIDKIRQAQANGEIIVDSPTEYAVWSGYVYFNRIPTSALVVYGDYWGDPTDMSTSSGAVGDATEPDFPLNQCDELILAQAKQIRAGDDGDLAKFDIFRSLVDKWYAPFIALLESGGKHQSRSNTIRRSRL